MTAKKETTGNGEAWRSAATHWAMLSSGATLHTSRVAATTASRHSNGGCNGGEGDGDGEDNGTSSSATARRNVIPIGVADKDGVAFFVTHKGCH